VRLTGSTAAPTKESVMYDLRTWQLASYRRKLSEEMKSKINNQYWQTGIACDAGTATSSQAETVTKKMYQQKSIPSRGAWPVSWAKQIQTLEANEIFFCNI
jgi:hypothetical protein